MGQQQSNAFSKQETLRALQTRILLPDDPIWDDILAAAADQAILTQLKFKEIATVFSAQPVNLAIFLYRFTTTLYALVNVTDQKLNTKEIIEHLRLFSWMIPPILSINDESLLDSILFQKGPLNTTTLIQGPRKIVHPPPEQKEKLNTDPILHIPGPESNANMSIAQAISSILSKLLFLPGFTISPSTKENIIWYEIMKYYFFLDYYSLCIFI